jgi:hypothetical protein
MARYSIASHQNTLAELILCRKQENLPVELQPGVNFSSKRNCKLLQTFFTFFRHNKLGDTAQHFLWTFVDCFKKNFNQKLVVRSSVKESFLRNQPKVSRLQSN